MHSKGFYTYSAREALSQRLAIQRFEHAAAACVKFRTVFFPPSDNLRSQVRNSWLQSQPPT